MPLTAVSSRETTVQRGPFEYYAERPPESFIDCLGLQLGVEDGVFDITHQCDYGRAVDFD